MNNKKYVWYVSYGSNLCYERFMCYITGQGSVKYNIEPKQPCPDTSKPLKDKRYDLKYKLYFNGYSKNWGCPPAYIETKQQDDNVTIGRAYLITQEQFEHVKFREGKNYKKEILLGYEDGIPVITLTLTDDALLHKNNEVNDLYKRVMIDGLMELGLSKSLATKYVNDRVNN